MAQFKARELDVLVATTVIEVGVDVPNATIMIVQEADRFGLAQLHQLRGRVGRGAEQSYCLLVSRREGGADRLGASPARGARASNDGFELAEEDLEIRGEGQLLGTRKPGLSDLRFTRLRSDRKLLERAREAAERLVDYEGPLNDEVERVFAGREAAWERSSGRAAARGPGPRGGRPPPGPPRPPPPRAARAGPARPGARGRPGAAAPGARAGRPAPPGGPGPGGRGGGPPPGGGGGGGGGGVSLATMLCVGDVDRSTAWYRDKLGFEVTKQEPGDRAPSDRLRPRLPVRGSAPTEDEPSEHLVPKPGGVILVLTVEDCREAYDELTERGVEFLTPPKSPPWGGWRCLPPIPTATWSRSRTGRPPTAREDHRRQPQGARDLRAEGRDPADRRSGS